MELERLSDAIDTMPSGVIIWDKDQKLFFAVRKKCARRDWLELKTGASEKICWKIH